MNAGRAAGSRRRVFAGALAIVVVTVVGCADDGGPRLTSVMPLRAPVGANVELRGERLCANHVECAGVAATVELGLSPPVVQATILAYTDVMATIQIPSVAVAGETDLVLTVDGRSSNALSFEVLP